jgi:glycosyltransferase involved in cell wall biosynthesis
MLSVLIPIYNFQCVRLVETIHKQLMLSAIAFEIICLDDASELFTSENNRISQLSHTTYNILPTNLGRIATRQQLANSAKYDWLLFLDADVLPKSEQFIQNYLDVITSDADAIYGGFAYHEEAPNAAYTLRWKYGKTKEQVSALNRNKTPCKIVISANFLIKKDVFLSINSHIDTKGYGYDNYFGALLKAKNSKVLHIDNEVYHLGIEDNTTYLNKVKQAVETLHQLYKTNKIETSENALLELFKSMKTYNLHLLVAPFYNWFQTVFEKQLTGKNPSIRLLQLYKLTYICYLDRNS